MRFDHFLKLNRQLVEHKWECSLPTERRADKWAGIQVGGNEELSQDKWQCNSEKVTKMDDNEMTDDRI